MDSEYKPQQQFEEEYQGEGANKRLMFRHRSDSVWKEMSHAQLLGKIAYAENHMKRLDKKILDMEMLMMETKAVKVIEEGWL